MGRRPRSILLVSDWGSRYTTKLSVHVSADNCSHDTEDKMDFESFKCQTSIDNWDEYLDRPMNPAIIRTNNNWIARLAFAAIPLPGQEKLIIGPKEICWACARHTLEQHFLSDSKQLFLC